MICTAVVTVSVAKALVLASVAIEPASVSLTPPMAAVSVAATAQAAPETSMSSSATFAFGNTRFHSDSKIGWDGFLAGLRGFEHFYNPVGNPLYFETPLNNSGVRFLYLHHDFADKSQMQGGDVNVVAMQARLAITERLAFIATKDGYSFLDAGLLPEEEGWNSIAAGLKYAFYVDRESDLVVTGGFRYMFDNGSDRVLQSGVQELSPFICFAKGFDRFHLMGNLTDRVPFDDDDGNNVLQWDLHVDYEIAPESLPGFAPMLELHGLHYLSDGTRYPLSVGGADYTNLGSSNVDGSTVIWIGAGLRWKLSPHVSLGADYEYPLTNRNADIFGDRFTLDMELTW